ncbi:DeoR/GlpR family DNA-binding transcription regulator [Spiroplasma cantharicola]|uniref:DeoR family transcriptional regulator n=1 Tax=Spiroplasma cantharicola TaxID=362837 RepID=A0A0M4K263_9MOLU|nr:DeoR/GlpR family DNA-binding transcription regulator [Spiroplasma cantharicola]ALD66812.1 DeoR family transcriptional regulator [Spiroplasma cantharicola]
MKSHNKSERVNIYLSNLNDQINLNMKSFIKIGHDYNIPEITVRRDVKFLEKMGYLKIDMGLMNFVKNKDYEITRNEKLQTNKEKKQIIAIKANELISSSEIFVGPGTTCETFIRAITKNINVLYTNGMEIARIANNSPNIHHVVIIGGRLRPQSTAMCGPIANRALETLKFAQSFITVTNVDQNLYLYNNHEDEAEFINNLINVTKETICLIDSSKINNLVKGNLICNIEKINTLVVDKLPDEEILSKIPPTIKNV